jgi:hypothetical protein
MAHGPMNYLFNEHDMFSWLDAHQKQIGTIVQQMQANTLLSRPTDDIVAEIVAHLKMDLPVIRRDQAHAEQSEAQIRNPNYEDYGHRGQDQLVTGTKIILHVPYSGNRDFFRVRPTTCDSAPPNASYDGNELAISVSGRQLNPESVKTALNAVLDSIEKYLGWQRQSVDGFNAGLEGHVRSAVEARKAKLLGDQNLVANLGFPLKHTNAPKTYIAPVTRKNVVQRPPSVSAPFKPEPAMDSAIYNEILDIMHSMTLVMERSPRAFVKMGEEDIRQQFLVQLNGRFEGAATGETFNYEGKTDILVRVDGKNIFIAECKFWGGPKAYIEIIDQLLGYLSWRDTKTAVVIFNRNKDFSNVLKSILETTETHANKKKGPERLGETLFRYTFSNPKDANRELILTVMVFDIPNEAA